MLGNAARTIVSPPAKARHPFYGVVSTDSAPGAARLKLKLGPAQGAALQRVIRRGDRKMLLIA
jgi:hypothetical protein